MKKSEVMSKSPKRAEPPTESSMKDAKKSKIDGSPTPASKVKEFCKNYAEAEEIEMEARNGEEDLQLFRETCMELRRLMTEILHLKTSGKLDDQTTKEMTAKRVEASLLFVTLKKLNRLDKLRLKKARDATHDSKQRVDAFHLELENLLYEVFHLRKEVDKCLEFKSKDEDIELISVEEFYVEAPPSISKPEITKVSQHKLTLARLEWEFDQRKRLSEQCRTLELSREKANSDISHKQKQLESLLPRLNIILEATRPLQEELNLPVERIKHQRELAALLPDPLYILYNQVKAFIEACDQSMQVTIEGKLEEAQNFGSGSKPTLAEEALEDVDSAESDVEMESETSKRAATSTKDKTDWQLIRHPLRVQLTIEKTVQVVFYYFTSLNIITVDCRLSVQEERVSSQSCTFDNLLSSLFPNDCGDESPNWVNLYQTKSIISSKYADMGKPYQWAQRLAGLDFNGAEKTAPMEFVNTQFVESVVSEMKNRVKHRFELEKTLSRLEKGELFLNTDMEGVFPPAISSRMVTWAAAGFEDCVKGCTHVEQLLKATKLNPKSMMFFKATIQRDSAELKAVVLVSFDYPNSVPVFSLELNWHGKHTRSDSEIIRSIEADVNVLIGDKLPPNKSDLLVFQLKKLCLNLDLVTEIDGQLMKKGSGSWQSSESRAEFPAEKMIPLLIKGHDRVPPNKFDAATGFFLHR